MLFKNCICKANKNITDALKYIEHNKHQTLGLSINPEKKYEFALRAAERGIDRITEIGKMSLYDYPWDGMFPLNRLLDGFHCQKINKSTISNTIVKL